MELTFNHFLFCLMVAFSGCKKSVAPPPPVLVSGFSKTPQEIAITGGTIPEASGIADSKKNPGFLWVEEDSGNPALIYLLGHDGKKGKGIPVANAVNRDWEDMVLGPGPVAGTDYIYLADIGDNNVSSESYMIYRFAEPAATDDNISVYDKIHFVYPDGSHNAEALFVDPATKDIYIVTKSDSKSKIYTIPYPQDTVNVNTATYLHDLDYNGVVSAAISADGKELIIKTYPTLYYYTRELSEQISSTLSKTPVQLGYKFEEQGEAVCFAVDHSGFYTLSEIRNSVSSTLDFYKRH